MTISRVVLLGCLVAMVFGCCDDATEPSGDESILRVSVLDGVIFADLMPVVAPDPIHCHLSVELRNPWRYREATGVTIPWAAVYLSGNREYLGAIQFDSLPAIDLAPLEADTIELNKVQEQAQIFEPPCIYDDVYVYLRLRVRDASGKTYIYESQPFNFECRY